MAATSDHATAGRRRTPSVAAALLLLTLSPGGRLAAQDATPPATPASGFFIVEYTLGPGWVLSKPPAQQAYFAEHSANLRRLRDAGQLLLGARYSDKGIVILKAPSETAAHAEVHGDPSVENGTFNVTINEFRPFYDGCVMNPAAPKAEAKPAGPFDWTVGSWQGTRRAGEDGSEAPMTVRVEPILAGAGQIEQLEVRRPGAPYRGVTTQAYDSEAGRWVRQYVNSARGRFVRLEGEIEGTPETGRSVWRTTTSEGRSRSRLLSERPATDRWRRTMSVSEDGGETWRIVWTDNLSKRVMNQKVIALYDEYTHRPLPRRQFLERLAQLAGGTTAALALLPLLENNYAAAAATAPDDPALETERVEVPGAPGALAGYLARRRKGGKAPAVIVIHENRGLNAHIEAVARRAAAAGFAAFAPDLLTRAGGTPRDEDQAREKIAALDAATTVADLRATVAWLAKHKRSSGKVGAVGFCWGGGMVNRLAVAEPRLAAGVVFYGLSPAAEEVPAIRARLLLHYAGLDERINQTVPAYEAALKAAGKDYRLFMYDGVQHAFHNDTNAARYDAAAAALAWRRTIEFLKESLAG